ELEEPLKEVKKEVDEREKRMKEERLARLGQKVQAIRDIATQARGKSSDEIAELISTVDAIDATEDFYELTHDAVNARAETLKSLGEAYNDRLSFEETQRQLAEQEAQRKAMEAEQAVERRINNLKMIPLEYMQRSYADTKGQLDRLVNFVPEEKDFAGRLDEVKLAMSNVISQLTAMADQKLVMEEMAAKQSAVQVEKDEPENFRKDPEPEIKAPALAVFDEKPAKEPEVVKLVTMLVTCSSADVNRIMKMVHTVAGAEISLLNN
ncbi:hypothetical protein, partial [Arsukibacterium sp.]|uniref:hypothetical protein n=1 Tax=Arsukibacterium sp. TaxID=1977258 RepID=UPI002FDA58FA